MRGLMVCFYDGGKLFRFELDGCAVFEVDNRQCPGLKDTRLNFSQDGGDWNVSSSMPIHRKGGGDTKSEQLAPGQIYKTSGGAYFAVYPLYGDSIDATFTLGEQAAVKIGRGQSNPICLNNRQVSDPHCEILRRGGQYAVCDKKSANGTYLNGSKVREAVLSDGDVIHILGYEIIFAGYELRFRNTGIDLSLRSIGGLSVPVGYVPKPPLFTRSPRLRGPIQSGEINISPPPPQTAKPEINWLPIILQPVITISTILLITFLMSMNSPGGFNPMMGMMSMSFAIASITVAILNYRSQTKKHIRNESTRTEKYIEYLQDAAGQLEQAARKQRDILTDENPDPRTCARIVADRQRRLWERTLRDEDFLSVRLGLAVVPAALTANFRETGFTLQEDELLQQCTKLKEAFQFVPDVPATLSLTENPVVGIVGGRAETIAICRNILVQLATQHGYDDVKIVLFYRSDESRQWDWTRWLPHCWDDDRETRFIAADKRDARRLSEALSDIFKRRKGRETSLFMQAEAPLPRFVCIVADPQLAEGEEIAKYLVSGNKELGISTLFLADSLSRLPGGCSAILECSGQLLLRQDGGKTEITPDGMTEREAENFSRSLAPIRLKGIGTSAKFPSSLTFLQGYGVRTPEELQIAKRWRDAEPNESLAVPIGVMPSGKTFALDLRENEGAHGPHGLVAGTTGFGKSELLQTLLLSLAVNFNPHDMTFVLIDFKGGGMANLLADLPHTVGVITNIDGDITRLLISLKAENERRLRLFAKAGVNHIDKYQSLQKRKGKLDPLARLVLVVDEFAALKKDMPDFVKELVAVTWVGRSQGIHLILATQKPGGVVDEQIWSNSRFKLCLKVASDSDSKEMLRSPDAAAITIPGRAYVLVGQDEVYELLQSYWSGAPYSPNVEVVTEIDAAVVELNGRRLRPEKKKAARSDVDELTAIVRHISYEAGKVGIQRLQGPWLEDLPPRMFLDRLCEPNFDGTSWSGNQRGKFAPVIGMFDNPSVPSQGLLSIDFVKGGHLCVFGTTGTGKSVFLHTLLASSAESYSPEEVQFYLLDFGGRGMGVFARLPHTGDVIYDSDEEKLTKFAKLINTEMADRKKRFEEAGVSNFENYAHVAKLPAIAVVVENIAAMTELYPDSETLLGIIAREGVTLGIYLIVTASTQNAIRYRISQNMKQAIAFQMTDKGDMTAIVGRVDGLSMPTLPGRGLLKGNPPLMFQTALIMDTSSQFEQAAALRERFALMNDCWRGVRPKKVPVMPERLTVQDLHIHCAEKSKLPIGMSIDVEPVYFDWDKGHCFLISAVSGGDRMVASMVKIVRYSDKHSKVYLFDSESEKLSALRTEAEVYLPLVQDNDAAIEQTIDGIIEELNRRKKAEREAEKVGTPQPVFEPWYIVVGDIKACVSTITDKTLTDGLARIVKFAGGLGVFVIAAGNTTEIQSQLIEQYFVAPITQCGQCVAIGGSAITHSFINIEVEYNEKTVTLPADEGWFISGDEAVRFKYAT